MEMKGKVKVNGEEQGVGDEEKRGDDAVKGLCVSSDTPELFTFTSEEVKAPSPTISNIKDCHNGDRSIKILEATCRFCKWRRR